jgi:hypothetical protein
MRLRLRLRSYNRAAVTWPEVRCRYDFEDQSCRSSTTPGTSHRQPSTTQPGRLTRTRRTGYRHLPRGDTADSGVRHRDAVPRLWPVVLLRTIGSWDGTGNPYVMAAVIGLVYTERLTGNNDFGILMTMSVACTTLTGRIGWVAGFQDVSLVRRHRDGGAALHRTCDATRTMAAIVAQQAWSPVR